MLEPLRFAYCNSVHSSTGRDPVYGRDPVLLIDVFLNKLDSRGIVTPQDFRSQLIKNLSTAFEIVEENLKTAREQFKIQYDKRVKDLGSQPGDKVLVDIQHNVHYTSV